jgi:hypothetical protein
MHLAVVEALWHNVCADATVVYFVCPPSSVLTESAYSIALVKVMSHL